MTGVQTCALPIWFLLLSLLALTTVVALQTVGVVLVLALLVTPGAAASLLSRKLVNILVISVLLAVFSTVAGFYASYYADLPSGPAIVLILSLCFLGCAAAGRVMKSLRSRPAGAIEA